MRMRSQRTRALTQALTHALTLVASALLAQTVGGRNGFGAKLTNIFSTEFVVETCDGKRQRRFRQVFRANMSAKTPPDITPCKSTDNWTCITFKPDLAKFGMTVLEEDTVALMRKRVYDVAGSIGKNTKVYLNGEKLAIKGFSDYVNLYLGAKEPSQRCYEKARGAAGRLRCACDA